jgi:hypothetical protein
MFGRPRRCYGPSQGQVKFGGFIIVLDLELETYRNRARTRLAGVFSLDGFTAGFGHRSSTSTSTISADKGEEFEGEDD